MHHPPINLHGHLMSPTVQSIHPLNVPVTRLENVTKCRIVEQQKAVKQGRDDSIKEFSTQLHPAH